MLGIVELRRSMYVYKYIDKTGCTCTQKMYLRARRPLDGKDNDALPIQIVKGKASIAKQKVFSIRRDFLGTLLG